VWMRRSSCGEVLGLLRRIEVARALLQRAGTSAEMLPPDPAITDDKPSTSWPPVAADSATTKQSRLEHAPQAATAFHTQMPETTDEGAHQRGSGNLGGAIEDFGDLARHMFPSTSTTSKAATALPSAESTQSANPWSSHSRTANATAVSSMIGEPTINVAAVRHLRFDGANVREHAPPQGSSGGFTPQPEMVPMVLHPVTHLPVMFSNVQLALPAHIVRWDGPDLIVRICTFAMKPFVQPMDRHYISVELHHDPAQLQNVVRLQPPTGDPQVRARRARQRGSVPRA
ncbi:hypothetical protein CYMTET_35162, partial [Cymbomonas tetramitiformis]